MFRKPSIPCPEIPNSSSRFQTTSSSHNLLQNSQYGFCSPGTMIQGTNQVNNFPQNHARNPKQSVYQDFSLDPPNSEIFPRYGTQYNHLNASPQNQMNSTYSGIQNYAPNYSYSGQDVAEHFQFNNPSQYSKNCNYAFTFHQNIPSSTYNYLNPNLNVLPGSKITQNHIQQKQERNEDNTSFKGQEKDFNKITNRGKLFPYSL